jgi:hypothetical protein
MVGWEQRRPGEAASLRILEKQNRLTGLRAMIFLLFLESRNDITMFLYVML